MVTYLAIASLFKLDFSYNNAALNKIWTGIARRAIPLR